MNGDRPLGDGLSLARLEANQRSLFQQAMVADLLGYERNRQAADGGAWMPPLDASLPVEFRF